MSIHAQTADSLLKQILLQNNQNGRCKLCMSGIIYLAMLFGAKVMDNALSTTKTIMIQRSRWILVGCAVVLSAFIYFWMTKKVLPTKNELAMLIVAVTSGVRLLSCLFLQRKAVKRQNLYQCYYAR